MADQLTIGLVVLHKTINCHDTISDLALLFIRSGCHSNRQDAVLVVRAILGRAEGAWVAGFLALHILNDIA